jgi:uncharacterized protein YcbK (DUF882 family)
MAIVVVLLFFTAWVRVIADLLREQKRVQRETRSTGIPPPPVPITPTRQITNAILDSNAPSTAYISDAMLGFLGPLRGYSGKLRFATRTAGSPIVRGASPPGSAVFIGSGSVDEEPGFTAPSKPGIYGLAVKIDQASRQIGNFNVITLVPFGLKQNGRIGLYYLGNWPFEHGGTPKTPAYANPAGFIEVTPENEDTQISEHFRLRDFLTKTQYTVWPKYLLLNPQLLDKLELTIQELEAMGHPVRHMQIMSGFRTPDYNHSGGNPQGRANLSRHMYGDASDVFVDNDGNGQMDDLNHDGRIDERDAEVILEAVERVEQKYPSLVGGVGVYSACCGHGPFTHIDVRGFRARWHGSGSG